MWGITSPPPAANRNGAGHLGGYAWEIVGCAKRISASEWDSSVIPEIVEPHANRVHLFASINQVI